MWVRKMALYQPLHEDHFFRRMFEVMHEGFTPRFQKPSTEPGAASGPDEVQLSAWDRRMAALKRAAKPMLERLRGH